MLAAIQFETEVWHLVRLVIALIQPLLVLLLVIGLVLAVGHLLTMIGTRWGDHRVTAKSMFFSVAMHLLLVGALIALIPEYQAAELLNFAARELEPIRVTVPQGNTRNPMEAKENDSPFELTGTSFNAIPPAIASERDRVMNSVDQPLTSEPLAKPNEQVEIPSAMALDRPQEIRVESPAPVAAIPEPAKQNAQMLAAEPEVQSLPQQARPGEGQISKVERSQLPNAPGMEAQSLQRPDQGTADLPVTELAPDRQQRDSMVIPDENARFQVPDQSTTRIDTPAPGGVTPRMIGQSTPDEKPLTPTPQRGRLETRTPGVPDNAAGIGRLRPREPVPMTDSFIPPRTMTSPGSELAASIPMERPELNRVENPFQPQMGGNRVPSAYSLRSEEERGKAVTKFGGSQETEDAVDRSLRWMAAVQNQAGYWHAGEYGEEVANPNSGQLNQRPDVGITSLAVLAFLGKQNTIDEGVHSAVVNRALRWIVSQQTVRHWGEGWGSTDGYLGGGASEFEAMYCHAMATFALAEAYAMSRNSPDAQWLRVPLQKAVGFILDTQNVDGGWRYVKGQREGDMSIFGWQLMALKSAQAAGITVDERRLATMRRFLTERRIGSSGGLAGFRPREAAGASAAAETLYCRQMLGMTDDPGADEEAVRIIVSNLPRRSTLNYYYWYYGTLALHQRGGPEWEQWNTAVRNMLVSEQRQSGPMTGSWDPLDVWGSYGGRMYSTAIATLSLEVYYRYLPLYRMNEPAAEK